ncbi:hypothetical protein A3D03_01435 [Candidatus Gottesmanbacteria bacterium RIFCSPHIGHO2_02_FULL_40_13]|uniref:DUF5652 domain-containing protein n=1 Tax=Candidatus Gottesmanbacteria bacterium RIFCSPHIGHO2_02_FULL_40_13 TaxID=1798384 RepID=A0A1F6AAM7_9BACT|nr:MAG: hypothetical protein A3D03_01435 [Candidatus Gottesmanbacteria bacterium RIFCSPHIGHO2_02_FULL_40_13]
MPAFDNNLYLLILIAVWDIIWKGIGLWKAARNGQKYWFIAMLLINSAGILPILYIKFFQKKRFAWISDVLDKIKKSIPTLVKKK